MHANLVVQEMLINLFFLQDWKDMVKIAETYLELVVELHDIMEWAHPLEEHSSSKYNLYLYNEANKQ